MVVSAGTIMIKLTEEEEHCIQELEAVIPDDLSDIQYDWQCYARNVLNILRRHCPKLDYTNERMIDLIDIIEKNARAGQQSPFAIAEIMHRTKDHEGKLCQD